MQYIKPFSFSSNTDWIIATVHRIYGIKTRSALLFNILMGTVTRFFCNAHRYIFASSIHKHNQRSMLIADGSANF